MKPTIMLSATVIFACTFGWAQNQNSKPSTSQEASPSPTTSHFTADFQKAGKKVATLLDELSLYEQNRRLDNEVNDALVDAKVGASNEVDKRGVELLNRYYLAVLNMQWASTVLRYRLRGAAEQRETAARVNKHLGICKMEVDVAFRRDGSLGDKSECTASR